MRKSDMLVVLRGGGDIATGTIHRLWSSGFRVLVLETDKPSAIRRQVAVCEAVYQGSAQVEDMVARRISYEAREDLLAAIENCYEARQVPVLVDPQGKSISLLKPQVVVDAILAKKNLGTNRAMAPLTIALGPGFEAGVDVDYVVETMRGHTLGRIISTGFAMKNTGVPGKIAGYDKERVIHSPAEGRICLCRKIGDYISQGEVIAKIISDQGQETLVYAAISGLLRGLITEGYEVTVGFKIADIDPRQSEYDNCFTISDKARCIAGSVLELICRELS